MLGKISDVRGGTVPTTTDAHTAATNPLGVAQLLGHGPKVAHAGTGAINPLYKPPAPTALTHYMAADGTVKPRGTQPLAYDAHQLKAEVGRQRSWGAVKNAISLFQHKTSYGQAIALAEKYTARAATMSPQEKITMLGRLAGTIGEWQRKHGDGSAVGASVKEQAMAKLMASVESAMDAAKFDRLTAALPAGVTLAQDGTITGGFKTREINAFTATNLKLSDDGPIEVHRGLTKLGDAWLNKGEEKAGLFMASGVDRDWPRMHVLIPKADGSTHDTYTPGDDEVADALLPDSVAALRAFAGSDEAATVLSGVANQYVFRELPRFIELPNGDHLKPVAFNMTASADIPMPDGTVRSFERAGMMANMALQLSKTPEGHFKADFTWDVPIRDIDVAPAGGDGSSRRVLSDANILMTVKASLVIDKDEAELGSLELSMPTPMSFEFAGKLDHL